jgi:hypothetical protein
MAEKKGNIDNAFNSANRIKPRITWIKLSRGSLTYALNATVENFDANSVNYQNESSNEFVYLSWRICFIGEHFINEQNKHIFPY